MKDHFTKCCWTKPLVHKEARKVYNFVREIFFMFEAAAILQSDNDREFVNELINSLQSDFAGFCDGCPMCIVSLSRYLDMCSYIAW